MEQKIAHNQFADSLSCLSHRLDQFLEHIDCGDVVVYGDLEAYSCEHKRHAFSSCFRVAAHGIVNFPFESQANSQDSIKSCRSLLITMFKWALVHWNCQNPQWDH